MPTATQGAPLTEGGRVTKEARPRHGAGREFSSDRAARTTFVVLLAVLAVFAIVAGRAVRDAMNASWWVDHTFAVEVELATLRSSVRAAEAAYLEFAVTGQRTRSAGSKLRRLR